MPKFRIEGEIYEAASPEEAYKKHDQEMARRVDYNRGANMSNAARAGLTAAQGATFNFADELAGALAMRGGSEAQRGAGMAGISTPFVDPMSLYDPAKQRVLGATESFAKEQPGAALTSEILGAALTLPLTMGASAVPATAGMINRGARFLRPIVGQSALGAVGSTEAETPEDFSAEVAKKTAEGTLYGGAFGTAGKTLGVLGRQIGPRLPGVGEQLATTPARERLAQLLERDAEARIRLGGDPITIAETRLRKFGPDAPLAVTGRETTEELGLLRNLPGAQQRMVEAETRRIQKQRGGALERGAEEAMDAQGVPFRATVLQYSKEAQAKAAPFYQQLEGKEFVVDEGLADLLTRSRRAFGEAEELAAVRGMPANLDLGAMRPGDRVPFEVLDNLKRTLYDIEEAAKGEFGKSTEKSRAYTQLRRSLISKLDELSPKDSNGQSIYKQARQAFEGEAQLETAMRRGRDALKEDAEELAATMADLEPSQLEAFRMGALQGIRDLAGTGAGQTRLLNLYKEPTLQAKMRTIFGGDFRKFQKAILQQEEIRRVERAGQGSQTFKLGARAEDQGAMMDALDIAQSAQTGGLPLIERVSRKFSQLRMPEQSRKELARLLLLRGEPAAAELRDMRTFMERRRRQQALAGQLSGRTGALTAPE
jgi:hypothetical protein